MLVVTRNRREIVVFLNTHDNSKIEIKILEVGRKRVRLGIDAPEYIRVSHDTRSTLLDDDTECPSQNPANSFNR